MSITILGVNYKTAPVTVREKIAFSNDALSTALSSLHQHRIIDGCVILSTCNRTEIYLSYQHESELPSLKQYVLDWLEKFHHVDMSQYPDAFYWCDGRKAIEHLMCVASGVDSMIVGESQILGQVKKAYEMSHQQHCLSFELEKLFHRIFHVAKRVRSETSIGSNTTSVAYAACLVARQLFTDAQKINIMLVGAGEMIELISRYLEPHGFKKLLIANRTYEKAALLAKQIHGEVISLTDIASRLHEVDVVISSTSSPAPLIEAEMAKNAMQKRQDKKMLFIDLAVPRDVEQGVSLLDNTYLYTIDDLQRTVNNNVQQRTLAANQAQDIIQDEAERFLEWLKGRQATDVIKQYRSQAEEMKRELEIKALNAIKNGASIDEVLFEFSHKLTNKLIHAPTQTLLQAATHDCDDCFKVLSEGLGVKEH